MEMMKLFNQSMLNAAGKVKTRRLKQSMQGPSLIWGFKFDRQCPLPLLTQQFPLLTPILQTFTRMDPPTSATDPDAHFDFFTKEVLPSLPRNTTSILIFIPSYFDLSECGTTSTTPLSPSVPSRKKRPSPQSCAHCHISSQTVTRFLFTVGERSTSAATTSTESQGWYPTPCRITLISTARSWVALFGGALARGGLRSSRRCV